MQKGLAAKKVSPREKLYLNAVAALFKDAGVGPKAARDEGYRDAMATAYASFPDDETKLFYGLATSKSWDAWVWRLKPFVPSLIVPRIHD